MDETNWTEDRLAIAKFGLLGAIADIGQRNPRKAIETKQHEIFVRALSPNATIEDIRAALARAREILAELPPVNRQSTFDPSGAESIFNSRSDDDNIDRTEFQWSENEPSPIDPSDYLTDDDYDY